MNLNDRCLYGVLRLPALLLGLFFFTVSIADVTGIIPEFEEEAQSEPIEVVVRSIVFLIFGVVFLAPYTRIHGIAAKYAFLAVLLIVTGYIAYISLDGITEYFEGGRHVAIVYTGVVMISITLANLIAFLLTIPKAKSCDRNEQQPVVVECPESSS